MPGVRDLSIGVPLRWTLQCSEDTPRVCGRCDAILQPHQQRGGNLDSGRVIEKAPAGEHARGVVITGTANTGHRALDRLQDLGTRVRIGKKARRSRGSEVCGAQPVELGEPIRHRGRQRSPLAGAVTECG